MISHKVFMTSRWLFFLLVILASCSQPKQFSITITGEGDLNNTQVSLKTQDLKITYDSSIVKNNAFTLQANKISAGFYYLAFKNKAPIDSTQTKWSQLVEIYIEEGKEYVFYAKDKDAVLYNNYTIKSNSHEQNKLNEYKQLSKIYYDSLKQEHTRLTLARNSILYEEPFYGLYTDSILDVETMMNEVPAITVRQFISDNNNTVMIPHLINQENKFFNNYSYYEEVLDRLNDDYKSKPETKKAYRNLKKASKLHLGFVLPDIAGKDPSGNSYNYDFSNKKVVLIDFWASWCTPCRIVNQELKQLNEKYKDKGFDIISVSMDQNISKWKNAINEDGLTWTNICEGVRPSKSVNYVRFNTRYIPLNYLVDNESRIIGRNIAPDSIERIMQGYKLN